MPELRNPGKRDTTLGAVRPGSGVDYRRALQKLIATMSASYEWWIEAKYRRALAANVDAGRVAGAEVAANMAQDAKPGPSQTTTDMLGELARLRAYWTKYFDSYAKKIAEQATEAWYAENRLQWEGKLRRAGFDIKMQLTPSQNLILRAKVQENVSLIRSIHEDYHKDVEGIVLRSFTAGRDLSDMAARIKDRGKVSTSRAALIARDQANKATAQMNAARQRELNLQFAVWVHSAGQREPREKHVRAGREQWVFNTQVGIDFGDGFGHVLPGEAIKCSCVSRTIIPAIGRGDIESYEDLEAVPGYPGAYRAKRGKDVGPKPKNDVTKTRAPAGTPVKYS